LDLPSGLRILSPEDMAIAMLGYGNKVTGKHIQLVDAIGSMVGKNPDEWAAIRQAAEAGERRRRPD
jgi:hypothetical protein